MMIAQQQYIIERLVFCYVIVIMIKYVNRSVISVYVCVYIRIECAMMKGW